MKKISILALPLIMALLSCSPPPFNLVLSQGSLTASRMTLAGTVGPINTFFSGQGSGDMAFYPQRDPVSGFTLQAGFMTWSWSGSQQIAYIASNGGQYQRVDNFQGLGMNSQDPPYPGFVIQSLKGGPANIVFGWDLFYSSHLKYAMMPVVGTTYAPPGWNNMDPATMPPGFPPSPLIRHASVSPKLDPAFDWVYTLVQSGTRFYEVQCDISSTGFSSFGVTNLRVSGIDLSSAIPSGIPPHALYYYNPNTTVGYANWWDAASSTWVTWSWYESAPGSGIAVARQLPGVTHRIDALLTTGELFSTEGGVGRVYDGNGNQEAGFPFAGMSFVGEVYVGTEAQLIFSQPLWYDNQLHFNIYTIASSRVTSLQ